jgi:hypothetical protein
LTAGQHVECRKMVLVKQDILAHTLDYLWR